MEKNNCKWTVTLLSSDEFDSHDPFSLYSGLSPCSGTFIVPRYIIKVTRNSIMRCVTRIVSWSAAESGDSATETSVTTRPLSAAGNGLSERLRTFAPHHPRVMGNRIRKSCNEANDRRKQVGLSVWRLWYLTSDWPNLWRFMLSVALYKASKCSKVIIFFSLVIIFGMAIKACMRYTFHIIHIHTRTK